jgi:hypothetical protein
LGDFEAVIELFVLQQVGEGIDHLE